MCKSTASLDVIKEMRAICDNIALILFKNTVRDYCYFIFYSNTLSSYHREL